MQAAIRAEVATATARLEANRILRKRLDAEIKQNVLDLAEAQRVARALTPRKVNRARKAAVG